MLHLKLCQIVHDLYSYKLLQNKSFKRDWWVVGKGGLNQRERTLLRGMDVFCDNNTMHVIYLDRIGYYCVLSIVLCFLLFQDTTHKAKEKEKGKSPNPVSKMNDIPFLVVYLQRHKSMAVGWKRWCLPYHTYEPKSCAKLKHLAVIGLGDTLSMKII